MSANISLSLILKIGKLLSLHSHTVELLSQTNAKCIKLTILMLVFILAALYGEGFSTNTIC